MHDNGAMHADTAPALDQLATPVLWLDADGLRNRMGQKTLA